jgi:hypothetical protein
MNDNHSEVPLAMRMIMWARVQPNVDRRSLTVAYSGDEVAEFTMWAMDLGHVPSLQEIIAKYGMKRRTAARRRREFLLALSCRQPPQWDKPETAGRQARQS